MGLRDQLLHNHIHHSPRREAQKPWHHRLDASRREHHQNAEYGLHDPGKASHQKRLPRRNPFLPQGKGNGRPFREILDADSQRQGKSRHQAGSRSRLLGGQREGKADGHSLRDIMKGNSHHQKGGSLPGGADPLRLLLSHMQVGKELIHQKQKQDPQRKTAGRRDPSGLSRRLRPVDSRDQKGPDGSRDHDARGEAQKDLLNLLADPSAEQKNHGGPQRGHKEGEPRSAGRPFQ